MKNDKLVPGIILVLIGAIFLLHNFGYLHFHWRNLINLWPIFLVIGGVNLLLAHNRSSWATILKISVVVGGFALILFGNFDNTRWWSHARWSVNTDSNDDNSDDNDNSDNGKNVMSTGSGTFTEPFDPSVKVARLNVSGGATTYRLNDTTNDLFKADTKQFRGRYQLIGHKEDSVYVMDFSMKDNKGNWNLGNNNESNIADMSLNTKPEWEININAGATELNFDLSKYKIREVKLNGGAGSFTLKMGQPLQSTKIDVSSAATELTVEIPQDAACSIESSGLTSDNFDGFDKKSNGHYETQNFDGAKNKIYIHLNGIAADFKVHKY